LTFIAERSVAENSFTPRQNTEDETCVEYALQFIVEVLYKIEGKKLSVVSYTRLLVFVHYYVRMLFR
jgi:hypothetical protein